MVALWYLSFLWMFAQLVSFASYLNQRDHALALRTLTYIIAALAVSFMCNLLDIAVMRWLLGITAGASTNNHVYYGVAPFQFAF